MKRAEDGTTIRFGWTGPLWLWHALADGSWMCRCRHSTEYRKFRENSR